jgi:hypothetical protein
MNLSASSSSLSENSRAAGGEDISRIKVANAGLYICTGGPVKRWGLWL